MTSVPPTTLRSLPQRSVRAADVVEADQLEPADAERRPPTRPAVPKSKSSSSQAPNVTNSACAAAVRPSIADDGGPPGGGRAGVGGRGDGGAGGPARLAPAIQAGQHDPGHRHDADGADAGRLQRHDVTAATSPSSVTPIEQPERPRRLEQPGDATAAVVGHVVGGPRDDADVEDDLGQRRARAARR